MKGIHLSLAFYLRPPFELEERNYWRVKYPSDKHQRDWRALAAHVCISSSRKINHGISKNGIPRALDLVRMSGSFALEPSTENISRPSGSAWNCAMVLKCLEFLHRLTEILLALFAYSFVSLATKRLKTNAEWDKREWRKCWRILLRFPLARPMKMSERIERERNNKMQSKIIRDLWTFIKTNFA